MPTIDIAVEADTALGVEITREVEVGQAAETNEAFVFKSPITAPTNISGLEFWYDASDSSTITESGGLVSQWDNKNGETGRDLTEDTIQDQPSVSSVNGNDSLEFDGVNSTIQSTELASEAIANEPVTVAVVFTPVDTTRFTDVVIRFTDSANSQRFRFETQGTDMEIIHGAGGGAQSQLDFTDVLADNSTVYGIGRFQDGDQDGLWSNGDEASTSVATLLDDTIDNLYVGSFSTTSGDYQGHVHEVVVYSRVITDAERAALAAYFDEKWLSIDVGQANETDSAPAVEIARDVSVGQATEADSALPIQITRPVEIAQAIQGDSALSVQPTRQRDVGQATENDAVLNATITRVVDVGIALEADLAQPIEVARLIEGGVAAETDSALSLSVGIPSASIFLIGEADETIPLQGSSS